MSIVDVGGGCSVWAFNNLEPHIQRGVGNTLDSALDNAVEPFLQILCGEGIIGTDYQAIVIQRNANSILKEGIITGSGQLDLEVS